MSEQLDLRDAQVGSPVDKTRPCANPKCDMRIHPTNQTGYCSWCLEKVRYEQSKKKCLTPSCTNLVSKGSVSGKCRACVGRERTK